MTIRAIVFDIGGVLELDAIGSSEDIGLNARWEQRLGLGTGELNRLMEPIWRAGVLGECTEEDVYREMEKRLGMSKVQVDEYAREMWDWYCGRLNEPMAAFFASLRPRYQTAILSNSFVGAREREQERYHFAEMTDFIIYSHEVGLAKPDRRIYELTCERLGLRPEEVIFLDDSEVCVTGARDYGMHAILFQNNAQAIAEIQVMLNTDVSTQ